MREQADCNFNYAFYEGKMTTLDATKLSVDKINNLQYSMADCSNLTSVIIPHIPSSANISNMFRYDDKITNAEFINCSDCGRISAIISTMNYVDNGTLNVIFNNFNGTYITLSGRTQIGSFDIINSETSQITSLSHAFNETRIKTFDFDLLDVTNVTTMQAMFANNPSLTSIHFGEMHTPYLTTIRQMF